MEDSSADADGSAYSVAQPYSDAGTVPLPVILAPTPQEGTQENTVKPDNAADAPKDNAEEGGSSAGDSVAIIAALGTAVVVAWHFVPEVRDLILRR